MSRKATDMSDAEVDALLAHQMPASGPAARRRSRARFLLILLVIYLIVLAVGAFAVWHFTPQRVKEAVYQTYVDPDSTQLTPRN